MKLMLKTDRGTIVRLAESMLHEVDDLPGSEGSGRELCLTVDADNDIPAGQGDWGKTLPTRLSFLAEGENAFGMLNVIVGNALLFSVLDLGDRSTQELLLHAPPSGFAVALLGTDVQKLVRVPVSHLVPGIAERCRLAVPADSGTKASCVSALIRHLNDPGGLRALGLEGLAFDKVLVSMVNVSGNDQPIGTFNLPAATLH